MNKLNLQDKISLVKADIGDLRNASIEDIDNIFSEDESNNENMLFLIKKDSICRLVQKLLEEKLAEDTTMLETKPQDNDDKVVLLNLRKEIEVLEEQLYRMSLAKAVIVPTDNLYRTKAEYDALREFNESLTKSLREAERKLSILYERNNILLKKVIDLEWKLEDIKAEEQNKD